jgi:hypothetical protein
MCLLAGVSMSPHTLYVRLYGRWVVYTLSPFDTLFSLRICTPPDSDLLESHEFGWESARFATPAQSL